VTLASQKYYILTQVVWKLPISGPRGVTLADRTAIEPETVRGIAMPLYNGLRDKFIQMNVTVPSPDEEVLPSAPSWAILAPATTSSWKGFDKIRYLFIL
jgi:hypothetical protein